MNRYPFAMPFGWFQVLLPRGPRRPARPRRSTTSTATSWRGATTRGEAHVMDAFCPHLGAHLGHGGTVEGCELVCPFHGWKFDAEGAQHRHPLQRPHQPQGARSARIPTVERNGQLLVWYHPDDEAAAVGDRGGRRDHERRLHRPDAHPLRRQRRASRRWARTASTRPTSATCTTPPRCPRSRAT